VEAWSPLDQQNKAGVRQLGSQSAVQETNTRQQTLRTETFLWK
jgi:hypothetical protein